MTLKKITFPNTIVKSYKSTPLFLLLPLSIHGMMLQFVHYTNSSIDPFSALLKVRCTQEIGTTKSIPIIFRYLMGRSGNNKKLMMF